MPIPQNPFFLDRSGFAARREFWTSYLDPWVKIGIDHIDKNIGENDEHGIDQGDAHDQRIIPVGHGGDEKSSHTGNGEYELDHERSGHQSGSQRAYHWYDGVYRIPY